MLRTVQDGLMTKIVKARDKNICQRCGSVHLPNSKGLHNSHYFTRGRWSTRYDLENCEALCYGCHRYFDSHKLEYKEWKIARMGEENFYKLERKSNKAGNKKYFRSKDFTKELKTMLIRFDNNVNNH